MKSRKTWQHARASIRAQTTTDGFKPYIIAIDDAFGADVDYAMLIKMYSDSGQPD
jgi:hypothetical protein